MFTGEGHVVSTGDIRRMVDKHIQKIGLHTKRFVREVSILYGNKKMITIISDNTEWTEFRKSCSTSIVL